MLIDNTLFLRERYPTIRQYFLENKDALNLNLYKIVNSKSGEKTLQFQKDDDSRPLMIHSLYAPIKEAEKLMAINGEKIRENSHVFFYGVGLGYHIEIFTNKYPSHTYSIYEPIPEVFMRMMENSDLKKIMTKMLHRLYIDQHNKEDNTYINELKTTNREIVFITLPSYENVVKEKYENFFGKTKETVKNRRTNLHTNYSFQNRWVINSIKNFKYVLSTPNILKDIDKTVFQNKPAIIVSAGPSLSEDIEHIRYIKDNNLAYIFSVGSAINSLIEYNVYPDAMFTYDPKQRNQKVFEKIYNRGIDTIPMVFGSSVGFETIERFKGPKIHFITSQDSTSLYFLNEHLNLDFDIISDSPSIAVMALQIAIRLGCSPVIFAGQNLGYLDGMRFAKGIDYAHKPMKIDDATLENSIITTDVFGGKIKTSDSFNNMRESIEKYISEYKEGQYINTTKGGAEIKGARFLPIERVINQYLTVPLKKNNWWESQNSLGTIPMSKNINLLVENCEELLEYSSQLNRILMGIKNGLQLKNEEKIIIQLQNFNKVYNRINKNEYYKYFLSLFMRIEAGYLSNEVKRINKEKNIIEKGNQIILPLSSYIILLKDNSPRLLKLICDNL